MMKYTEEFYCTRFKGKDRKDAYLRACKWYATNVLSKDELHNVHAEFEKEEQSPTITLHLYITLYEDQVREEHCRICKEVHKSFLMNENVNCDECKLKGYQKRVDQKIAIKKAYYRELIERNWE